MLNECNDSTIDFAIVPEDFYTDSYLGLNIFKQKRVDTNVFISGLYYNYFYCISGLIYTDIKQNKHITNFSDFKNFKKVYKRNLIIGTEEKNSNSYVNLITLLYFYKLTPIDFEEYDENHTYKESDIFFVCKSKDTLVNMYISNKLDAIFIVDTNYSKFIRTVVGEKKSLFLNFKFENSAFDKLFANHYIKKTISLDNLLNEYEKSESRDDYNIYDNGDILYNELKIEKYKGTFSSILNNSGSFETRGLRNVLITNRNSKNDIVYTLGETIFRNNNYLINKCIFNTFSNKEHLQFEPIDLVYLNEHLSYHPGIKDFYYKYGFLLKNKKEVEKLNLDTTEKLDYYWKYKKIGDTVFKFDD